MIFSMILLACSTDNTDTSSKSSVPQWYGDIEPIITENCAIVIKVMVLVHFL